MRLDGKRALVTGASGGIGREIAKLFALEGAVVGVHYNRDAASAKRVVREIEALGGKAELLQADLSKPAACRTLVRRFARKAGLDVLVNNAGAVAGYGDYSKLSESDWDATFAVNARAPFTLSKEALALMRRDGRIINVSSVSAKYGGSANTLHYGASKAALESLTVGLARLAAKRGILVNALRPGFIDTDVHKALGRADVERRIAMIPLGRAGKPEEVAQAALFLASDAASYVTGQILSVAGGD